MGWLRLPPENEEHFSGDNKKYIIVVDGITLTTSHQITLLVFNTEGQLKLKKDRTSGITSTADSFTILFTSQDTVGLAGDYSFQVRAVSPASEYTVLAHGLLSILADRTET